MSLIDSTYFVGDIALSNLDEIENTFQDSIDLYEKEILTDLLGYQLYNAFITGIGETTPAQIWLDLRDGAEFTFDFCGNTITKKWNGLINNDKISLIAYYVYYKHRYENLSTTTSINDVQGIPENASKVNDVRKMSYAWNNMMRLYGEFPIIIPFYNRHYVTYSWFDKYSDTYEYYTDEPSAYNFLNANRENYDNWIFDPKNRINEFGI